MATHSEIRRSTVQQKLFSGEKRVKVEIAA